MTVRVDPRAAATEARIAAETFPDGEAGWASAARQAACKRLRDFGLPQRRDEYWRFTDPARVTGRAAAGQVELPAELAGRPGLSLPMNVASAAAGIVVEPLTQALKADVSWVSDVFGQLEADAHRPVPRALAALVTAFATHGAAMRVTGDAGQYVVDHNALPDGGLSHSVLKLDEGSNLTLIEVGTPRAGSLSLLEIEIGAGATLHHLRLQDGLQTGVAHVVARIGAGGGYQGFTLGAQGTGLRNETVLTLAGSDGRAHVGAAWIGQGDVHHDDTVFITHAAPNCESRQVFRSVLGRGAVAAFQGKILVNQIAQKTDGYQLSQSLLLDDDAQFLGKPELEIYADDVKCSHGSTTGSIDETALYYLRSRGVPERQARHLLVLAFLNGTLDEVADPGLREILENRISALAEQFLT